VGWQQSEKKINTQVSIPQIEQIKGRLGFSDFKYIIRPGGSRETCLYHREV